jgi:ferredoxin
VKDEEVFDRLPEACDEEEDLLDLAFDLRETSRLGCQVILTEDLDGIEVEVPSATRNFYVDGHVPQPH